MNNDENIFRLTREKIQKMCNQFDFIEFYKTKPCKAFIVITQYDVIIISSNKENEEYKSHSEMRECLFAYMQLLNRLKYSNITCKCASTDKINVLTIEIDNLEGEKLITKEMIEAMRLIDELVSLIGKDNESEKVIKGNLEDIENYFGIKPTENYYDLEEAQLIGIPITNFIEELRLQIAKYGKNMDTSRKEGKDAMELY